MPRSKPVISVRRPPPAAPIDVDSFVAGGHHRPDAQTSSDSDAHERAVRLARPPAIQAPSDGQQPGDGPGLVQRQSGRVRRRMTIYLPPELAKGLAVHCAQSGAEISSVVATVLERYLERR